MGFKICSVSFAGWGCGSRDSGLEFRVHVYGLGSRDYLEGLEGCVRHALRGRYNHSYQHPHHEVTYSVSHITFRTRLRTENMQLAMGAAYFKDQELLRFLARMAQVTMIPTLPITMASHTRMMGMTNSIITILL